MSTSKSIVIRNTWGCGDTWFSAWNFLPLCAALQQRVKKLSTREITGFRGSVVEVWHVSQRLFLLSYRGFGTAYGPRNVGNHQPTLRIILEVRRPHVSTCQLFMKLIILFCFCAWLHYPEQSNAINGLLVYRTMLFQLQRFHLFRNKSTYQWFSFSFESS